jgi:hypothetical protein
MDVVVAGGHRPKAAAKVAADKITTKESDGQLVVNAGRWNCASTKGSGLLAGVSDGGKSIPLANGPRFIAYAHDTGGGRRGSTVTYHDLAGTNTLTGLTTRTDGDDLMVEANYDGAFKQASLAHFARMAG